MPNIFIDCGRISGGVIGGYSQDAFFTDGTDAVGWVANADVSNITDPPPASVFNSIRYIEPRYTITGLTPNASHKVRLFLTEASINPGRVFNIIVGGVQIRTGYNIYEEAGGCDIAVVVEHTLNATAGGQITIELFPTSTVAVINAFSVVEQAAADSTPPTVTSFTATANSPTQITLNYAATDNVAVTGVDLDWSLDNANWKTLLLNSADASPFVHAGRSASTQYFYRFRARDAAGNISQYSTAIATTPAGADNTPPTVSITTPANNSTVSGTISVAATAADDVAVQQVTFKLGTESLTTKVAAPFSFDFDTTAFPNGVHSLTAIALDTSGNSTTSAPVQITINNVAPPPQASFTKSPNSGFAPLAVNFTDTSTGSPASWAWNFGDGGTSNLQNPSHTFAAVGTYTITLTVTNANGSTSATQTITVSELNLSDLPHGFPSKNCELFCEPESDQVANGQAFSTLIDHSSKNRNLTAASNAPTCATPVLAGRAVVRFDGSKNPLSNPASFQVNCGWMVAKYNGETFAGYPGLLSDLQNLGILVGNNLTGNMFDFYEEFYEYRADDRIYPAAAMPGPMNAFKIIFFRFWQPVVVGGIQIGQDRATTARKWNGDVAFLALYSRNFCESDVRKYSQILADLYALEVADVFPFQADRSSSESSAQSVNFYDPPEGSRISDSIENPNRTLDLQFSSRRASELRRMRAFHHAHYAAAVPCIYRDYSIIPPEDIEGYIDSEYEKSGAVNNYDYSFSFRENNSAEFTPQQAANYLELIDAETGLILIQEI